jgi:hypothetical protein
MRNSKEKGFVGNLCISLLVPDLGLELVNEGLHPLVVLPVLLLLEGQLLDPPLASAQVLLRIAVAPALCVQLRLQLPVGLGLESWTNYL